MHVVNVHGEASEPNAAPIFDGTVHTRALVSGTQGAQHIHLLAVTFSPGARTKLHYHSNEQILLITEGRGIVATVEEEHHVTPGDVVFVPGGEHHWHGAEADFSMTHLAVNGVGETHIVG